MKTIFNKQKRSVAGVLIALTALTTALTGCQEDFELDLPLAVSARELSLTKDPARRTCWSTRTATGRRASRVP